MAKKRVEQPADDEQEPIEYNDIEPEAVEEVPKLYVEDDWATAKPLNIVLKPGGPAVSLDTDERTYRVSFALPYGVLVALLDDEHSDADVDGARQLGLLNLWGGGQFGPNADSSQDVHGVKLTELGELVLAGIDQTAIRHKMLAAWREQHNRGVDSDKTGFKKA